jgi:hypothetical protein
MSSVHFRASGENEPALSCVEESVSLTTRKRVMWCAVIALFTLPAEWLLVSGLSRGDGALADIWVKSLDASELSEAAAKIEDLPAHFRKSIITGLTPSEQAKVWEGVIERFIARSELENAARLLLDEVKPLALKVIVEKDKDAQSRLRQLSDAIHQKLGSDAYRQIFLTAGPEHDYMAGLPMRVRLQNYLEEKLTARASFQSCNCNMIYFPRDCNSDLYCSQTVSCTFWYVGCGVWYQDACDGYCLPRQPT